MNRCRVNGFETPGGFSLKHLETYSIELTDCWHSHVVPLPRCGRTLMSFNLGRPGDVGLCWMVYPLVNIQKAIFHRAIEIADFYSVLPMKNGDVPSFFGMFTRG